MAAINHSHLFLCAGIDRADFLNSLSLLATCATADFSQCGASDITVTEAGGKPLRAGIIADSTDDLTAKITLLKERLKSNVPASFQIPAGVYFGDLERLPAIGKTAFLFPGFNSQHSGMLGGLRETSAEFSQWFSELAGLVPTESARSQVSIIDSIDGRRSRLPSNLTPQEQIRGVPACLLSSLLLDNLLKDIGVYPDVAVGYSVGELAALICGGYIPWESRLDLVRLLNGFGDFELWADAVDSEDTYRRIAVNGEFRRMLPKVMKRFPGKLFLQFDNCSHSSVLCGSPSAITGAVEQLSQEVGVITMPLPYMAPLHTPWYSNQATRVRKVLAGLAFSSGKTPLLSGTSLDFFPTGPVSLIRDKAGHQWTNSVRFREALERLADDGVRSFVEVGPGSMLTGFVTDTIGSDNVLAVATDKEGVDSIRQLQAVLASFFVRGTAVRPNGLKKHLRPLVPTVGVLSRHRFPRSEASSVAVLKSHFSLMRDFLGQQGRMMAQFGQTLPTRTDFSESQSVRKDPSTVVLSKGSFDPTTSRREDRKVIVEWQLNATSSRFLNDHCFGRIVSERQPELRPLAVLPFTVSVEFMARAAIEAAGTGYHTVLVENIQSLQWITADTGQLGIRVIVREHKIEGKVVQLQPQERVYECALYSADTLGGEAQALPSITARIRLAREFGDTPRPLQALSLPMRTPRYSVDELYRYCLFHGPAFQVLKDHTRVSDSVLEMTVALPESDIDSETAEGQSSQTWPYLMDSIGQMAAVWLLEQGVDYFGSYPSRIDSMEWFGFSPKADTSVQCVARCSRESEEISADFDFVDSNDAVIARVQGLTSRLVNFPNDYYGTVSWPSGGNRVTASETVTVTSSQSFSRALKHFPKNFFTQSSHIWLRVLAHAYLTRHEREHFLSMATRSTGVREEWLLRRVTVKDVLRDWFEAEHDLRLAAADLELTESADQYRAHCIGVDDIGQIPAVTVVSNADDIRAILVIDKAGNENSQVSIAEKEKHLLKKSR